MDILIKKLVESGFFIEFDPYLLNKIDRYRTDKVRFHMEYEENLNYYQIPKMNPVGTIGYEMAQNKMTNDMHISTIVGSIIDCLYKYIISKVSNNEIDNSNIEKVIQTPMSFLRYVRKDDIDYYVLSHSAFILHDFSIKKMDISGYENPMSSPYNSNKMHYFDVEMLYSYPDKIMIEKVLSDKDEIKLFNRKKAIEKFSENYKND